MLIVVGGIGGAKELDVPDVDVNQKATKDFEPGVQSAIGSWWYTGFGCDGRSDVCLGFLIGCQVVASCGLQLWSDDGFFILRGGRRPTVFLLRDSLVVDVDVFFFYCRVGRHLSVFEKK